MAITTYARRQAAHAKLRKKDLTADPRRAEYTEVMDDADWVMKDEQGMWGGDDSHNDMLGFCPSDACLVEWRCGPGRTRWLTRAEEYRDDCPEYARLIKERVEELDARFSRFGSKS